LYWCSCIIGKNGVEEIIEIELNDEKQRLLSVEAVRAMNDALKSILPNNLAYN
jgi:malate dehydrogenase